MYAGEGVVQLMEGAGEVEVKHSRDREEIGRNEWWGKGVTLSIWLRADVMERLIADRGLRAFA